MKKWIISIVILIIVIGAGATTYGYFNNKTETTTAPQMTTQKAVAEMGSVEVAVSGTGNISTINSEVHTASGNATVDEVLVAVGDIVAVGDELVTFLDDEIDPIEASFAGEVTTLNVEEEMNVQMGTEVVAVTDYTNLQMIVDVDELDIAKVQVGQTAKVDISALTDSEFTGTVTSVAKEANEDSSSTVAKYAVNMTINEPTGIKVGMTAEATITTEKKDNILTVPVAAIQKQGDESFVLIPSEENATTAQQGEEKAAEDGTATAIQTEQKTVEIGLQNDTLVEITSGLSEGEEVVLPSLNSDSNSGQNGGNMFQGGFPGGQGQGGFPDGGQGQRPAGFQGGNRGGDGQ